MQSGVPRWEARRSLGASVSALFAKDGLELDLDVDPLAHEPATGLDRDVPGHVPVLALDRGRGSRGEHRLPERASAHAEVLALQGDGPGHAADRQIAVELEVRIAGHADGRARERQ